MAGIKALVCLAFSGSIGMTLLILACALPGVWWPFFVLIFYALAPIPTVIAQRYQERSGIQNSSCMEFAIFLTMGCVISSFALPIVLARSPVLAPTISWQACYLTLTGNVVILSTILGFFMIFYQGDSEYSMW